MAGDTKTSEPGRTERVQFVGQTVGYCVVLEALGGTGKAQRYRVRFTCCGTERTQTHEQLLYRRKRIARSNYSAMCRPCYIAALSRPRAPVGGLVLADQSDDPLAYGPTLEDFRRAVDRTRAERDARIAQRREKNSARVERAHVLAMSAPPPPVLSAEELRDLRARQRRARSRRPAPLPVTPGFEAHPRTMAEVLARAAAHQARAGARS